jgi:cytochrome P450
MLAALGDGRAGMRSLVRYLKEFARAHLTAVRYPPGRMRFRDPMVHSDPRGILRLADRLGPVFKQWPGRHTTYVLGNRPARRFLAENEDKISGVSVNLTSIVPGGWIRQMRGETHQKYRRILLDGLDATPLLEHQDALRETIAAALDAIAAHDGSAESLAALTRQRLRDAARTIMIRLFLGVAENRPPFAELSRLYDRFGPDAPVPRIRRSHAEAYRAIRVLILEEAAKLRAESTAPFSSVLRRVVEQDALDETSLGQIIYMVEPSYFDTSSLWRWMLKILADNEATVEEMAPAFATGGETARRMARCDLLGMPAPGTGGSAVQACP